MAINPRYITYPITQDSREAMQRVFDYLAAKIPGWEPSEGNLDVWMIEAIAGEAAVIGQLTGDVTKSIFKYYGETLFGIPPIAATSASAQSTWVANDTNGYTVPAGTQVSITNAEGEARPFFVLQDVIIPTGFSSTSAGQVTLVAVYPGVADSGLGYAGASVQLQDLLPWVYSITLTGPTAGGADEESDDAYLSRLSLVLQTMSPRPILAQDFAILATTVAGVQRAVCIDGYNPADSTFGNERMVCIVALDSLGHGVSGPVKATIQAYLDSMREINFVVNTADPTVTLVDVTAYFTTFPSYDPNEVEGRVQSAINQYLDPRQWGIDRNDNPNDPQTWNNVTHVRYLELTTLVNNISGVDVVTMLTLGPHSGTQLSADLDLTGVVPLPNPGTIVVVGS